MPVLDSNKLKRGYIGLFWGVMLSELFIGGAGRIFAFGGVTLRMVFFVMALTYTATLLLYKVKFNADVIYITIAFIALNFIAILMGLINAADNSLIVENFLMGSFFLTFPFFSQMINTNNDVDRVIKVLKACALLMAVLYLGFLVLLISKIIPFKVLYNFLNNPEFGFRGSQAVFYKGFLFMCCGLFFYIGNEGKRKYLPIILILTAVVATFVRGFLISFLVCYFFYLLFVRNIIWSISFALLALVSFPFILNYYLSVLGNRTASDQVRYIQFDQVLERTNPFSILIGNGYGIGVPIRPNHFEINFLEIFYKQGILGLVFWIFMLAIVVYKFLKAKKNNNTKKAIPFLLSCFFLYIQSASNPFLTNSMGMTVLFISILCLDTLSKKQFAND